MYTNNEIKQMLIDDVTSTLRAMEESYEEDFQCAIDQIRHAECDMVCFGMREAQSWDYMILSAVTLARNTEKCWKEARALYEDVMKYYGIEF